MLASARKGHMIIPAVPRRSPLCSLHASLTPTHIFPFTQALACFTSCLAPFLTSLHLLPWSTSYIDNMLNWCTCYLGPDTYYLALVTCSLLLLSPSSGHLFIPVWTPVTLVPLFPCSTCCRPPLIPCIYFTLLHFLACSTYYLVSLRSLVHFLPWPTFVTWLHLLPRSTCIPTFKR